MEQSNSTQESMEQSKSTQEGGGHGAVQIEEEENPFRGKSMFTRAEKEEKKRSVSAHT